MPDCCAYATAFMVKVVKLAVSIKIRAWLGFTKKSVFRSVKVVVICEYMEIVDADVATGTPRHPGGSLSRGYGGSIRQNKYRDNSEASPTMNNLTTPHFIFLANPFCASTIPLFAQ